MSDKQSNLFNTKSEKEIADNKFTDSYKLMETEVDRTSKYKFTLWGLLTSFIYKIIHGTDRIAKYATKDKVGMNLVQMKRSSAAFDSVSKTLKKCPDKSLNEKQIFDKTEKSLK